MIEKELLFLGLLKESPKHGYDIKVKVQEILSLFAGVELKSIYYPLKVLAKKGLIAKRSVKFGRRPQRTVYYLTPRGEVRFQELLNRSLLELKRPQFNLDLSLYFLHYLKPEAARRRLRGRAQILKKVSAGLTEMLESQNKQQPSLGRILEHNLQMIKAEMDFLENLNRVL